MLLTRDLIKDVENKNQIEMLKKVNIPDFTKCIAQFSGLQIRNVSEEVIKDYLLTWARNKERFYLLLDKKLKIDIPFKYSNTGNDGTERRNKYRELSKKYPLFSLWIEYFEDMKENKINGDFYGFYGLKQRIKELFPYFNIENSKITHFFKSCLNAPESLINDIAAIYENNEIEANHTISIDPVDMMLASENPYDWNSCYRLELDNSSSHADGCLAAVLDTQSLITYVWTSEGKFKLYDTYDFKSIRYYRMREWIAISDNMHSVHFNVVYPGKDNYNNAFLKILREIVENKVASYLDVENVWRKYSFSNYEQEENGTEDGSIYIRAERVNGEYGYSEYDSNYVYTLKGFKHEHIGVYDEEIKCPCGCGEVLPGSSSDNEYNGAGFICDNFEEAYEEEGTYCDYLEDYCEYVGECCRENCEDCEHWREYHPVCELDEDVECSNYTWSMVDDGIAMPNEEHCRGCECWDRCHSSKQQNEEDRLTVNVSQEQEGLDFGSQVPTVSSASLCYNGNPLTIASCDDTNGIIEKLKNLVDNKMICVNDSLIELQQALAKLIEGWED